MRTTLILLASSLMLTACEAPSPSEEEQATIDDELDGKADTLAAACSQAGGVCTSFAFLDSEADACGGNPELAASCGEHTMRVCCPVSLTRDLKAPPSVSYRMPSSIISFLTANDMGDHHLGWHMSRRWDRLSTSNQAWLTSQGWSRAAHQEGEQGNGIEFLAMHRFVLQTLREVSTAKSTRARFDGWGRVPDPADGKLAASGPDSLTGNPLAPDANSAISDELRKTIDLCQDHPAKLKSFATDDDFGRFLETTLGATLAGAGVHNQLHGRFSQPGSTIDLGDPRKNFKNVIFWRLHGWIDRCWATYRQTTGKKDDDPAYVAALAKGAQEMHLAQKSP